jgi:CDP-glucose 4,6-dehydratase
VAERHGAVETMVIDRDFWRGRRVLLTGHTGFKGAWMSMLLGRLGAEVYGFALPPEEPSLFLSCGVERDVRHRIGDVRDLALVQRAMVDTQPEIVIHMAAQALVQRSYAEPVATYATNVMGTVNVLEAIRQTGGVRAALIVTSDKCYENRGWERGYRETDAFGGSDPYSSSKGCAEIVAAAYRRSFFAHADGCHIASVRAGNVIGGGDWARDRLVPDAMRAFSAGAPLRIRNPNSVRPWQHVLDPVLGYLHLAARLVDGGAALADGWNFGPASADSLPVRTVVDQLAKRWGDGARWELDSSGQWHPEQPQLRLDCTKARTELGWTPLLGIDAALQLTVEWYRAARAGADLRSTTIAQIEDAIEVKPVDKTHRAGRHRNTYAARAATSLE